MSRTLKDRPYLVIASDPQGAAVGPLGYCKTGWRSADHVRPAYRKRADRRKARQTLKALYEHR